jgi:hypothetical protein
LCIRVDHRHSRYLFFRHSINHRSQRLTQKLATREVCWKNPLTPRCGSCFCWVSVGEKSSLVEPYPRLFSNPFRGRTIEIFLP